MYKLYVIPGSHACRSAILMLEHKKVAYRRVDVVTLLHPLAVRLRGFDAGGETRTAGAQRTLGIRVGDLLGTVPALAADGQRVSTNRQIARFLDDRHPEPSLFPADSDRRRGHGRGAAERRRLHGRAQPGADPLSPRCPAPVRGAPGPRARRSAAA